MKKTILVIILASLIFLSPSQTYASSDLIKPSSRFYFLQIWGESFKLFFTQSKESKINYLLELSDKRVEEMKDNPSPQVSSRYEEHFQELSQLATQVPDKEQVAEKIKDASIRQQEVLSKVYSQAPERAKEAIINAQENSAKHVSKTIEVVEGTQKAQDYAQQAAQIQQAEKMGQVEQIPMEGSPNSNPSKFNPRELKGTNQQNQLNPINAGSKNQDGGGGGQIQSVQPIQLNQPSSQN